MHDIKIIRKNLDFFKKKISERNTDIDFNKLIDLDKNNRELIQNKEKLEQEKKSISQTKDEGLFKKSKELSSKIELLNKDQIKIKQAIDFILCNLPNLACTGVPIGKDESENTEIKKVGKISNFDFKPLSHSDIGKKNGLMDFDTAAKTSGARFVFLKKDWEKFTVQSALYYLYQ